jgi:hypothetical protein
MNNDPIGIALREVTEAKNLLEALITSSESFDYLQAKVVLRKLNRKIRELGRFQSRCQATQSSRATNVYVLDFKKEKPTELRS